MIQTQTAVDDFGDNNKPCVVLIHGLGLNRACWQWMIPELTKNFRVLAFDLYGHGESAAPTQEPSLSMFSDQVKQLMKDHDVERAVVIGFSLGGMIARRFAQDAPEKTRGLVILNSAHTRTTAAQTAIRKRVLQAKNEGASATVEDALDRWFTPDFRAARPDVIDLVRSWVMANDQSIYYRNYHVLAEGVSEIVAPHPPLSCPALVITADQDFGNDPAMARQIASEIANSETVIVPGLRHMALAEDPAAVNRPVLRFLGKLEQEAPA